MKKSLFIFISLLLLLYISGCASKPKVQRERDETFIADIDSFEVGEFHLYAAFGINQPKIQDYSIYFIPRTNNVIVKGRVGIDFIEVVFSYNERIKLLEAKNKYINDYEQNTFTKEKPNKKNAYSTGITSINWGTFGPAHEADTKYITNVQYILEGKPYFRIQFEQAQENVENGVSSPRFSIYISPSQWEKILEACNQERLVAMTDEILAEADAF